MRIFLLALLSTLSAQATILPENDLHREDRLLDGNIDEAKFNSILDHIESFYQPLAKKHKSLLIVSRNWSDPTVNASAARAIKILMVSMYGGLARRPEVTPDAFALVACHELGHLFGGYPFIWAPKIWGASNEGQADYYATHVCAKKIWEAEIEANAAAAETVNAEARVLCDMAWTETNDRNLCYRSANAGESLAILLHRAVREKDLPVPQVGTPSTAVVKKTYNKHPLSQCRLDTYIRGAICTKEFKFTKIPGWNYYPIKNSRWAEKSANKYSCSVAEGMTNSSRPSCWFHAKVTKKFHEEEDLNEDLIEDFSEDSVLAGEAHEAQ